MSRSTPAKLLSIVILTVVVLFYVGSIAVAAEAGPEPVLGELLKDRLWTVAPFAILLGCIAILPLAAGHWWEHNFNKGIVVAILAIPLAIYLAVNFGEQGQHKLIHTAVEYVLFLNLLGSLFIVSGGIYIQGSLSGTPLVNTGLMAIGAILASVIGTTGASMVLIRPLIRANASRKNMVHVVVFFIFVVSNCGGLLTPLGDPPLFLGFMKGVPFEWTLQLWPQWLFVNLCLLVAFNIWDQFALNKEELDRPGSQLEELQRHEPLRIVGLFNLVFFAAIVAINLAAGYKVFERFTDSEQVGLLIQAGLMIAVAAASYATTSKAIHQKNNFSFGPIIEVAVIFAGIFIAMLPALEILGVRGGELGVDTPAKYFWASGILSSFLDNAPTYLTFAATACGSANIRVEGEYLKTFLEQAPNAAHILAAISCGSVFMGANTYIGNGPNFMVKAIAEQNNVRMPSFFGYMLYSVGILIPIFIASTFIFFQ